MERIFRLCSSIEVSELSARDDDNALTYQQRFHAFMQLLKPFYAASPGFQRVYRIDDFEQRSIRDDWGRRIQPLSEPAGDR